jgi:hypothetical protein
MKMVKSLLLGSAAGVVAMAGAQAADLPVKAKPVQYVKICSLYGVGFYYVPGTDMCIKVGGWARFEVGNGWNGTYGFTPFRGDGTNRLTAEEPWRVKGTITVDARDQTPYGTVRSYVAMGISDSLIGNNTDTLYPNRWFIQWAGFTFGKTVSFFDFYNSGAHSYGGQITANESTGDGGWLVMSYTAQLGNGLSATIGAEQARSSGIVNTVTAGSALAFGTGSNANGTDNRGQDNPDVVGNIRVDQAWGSAQIAGALHNVAADYYIPAIEGSGHPGDQMGFAIGGGLKLNAPMIGHGDYFEIEADYSQGASRYLDHGSGTFNYAYYEGNSLGYGIMSDAVYGGSVAGGTASGLELTTSWAVNAAYVHNWNPQWATQVFGGYLSQSYSGLANAMLCTNQGFGVGGVGTAAVAAAGCDNDWSAWSVGTNTRWNISKTFYIGLEVLYNSLQSGSTPTGFIVPSALPAGKQGATPYAVGDKDAWLFKLRVHRDFYP